MNTKIYREDEQDFPEFKSLEDARQYFQTRYNGEYYCGDSVRMSDDAVCYFDNLNYQPVEIFVYDDGFVYVHVVY